MRFSTTNFQSTRYNPSTTDKILEEKNVTAPFRVHRDAQAKACGYTWAYGTESVVAAPFRVRRDAQDNACGYMWAQWTRVL